MDAKSVAIALCVAALIAAFLGWNKAPATTVTLAPALTLAPSVATLAPGVATVAPVGIVGGTAAGMPTAGPAVLVTSAPVSTMFPSVASPPPFT